MDLLENLVELVSLTSIILLMLLNTHRAMLLCSAVDSDEESCADIYEGRQNWEAASSDLDVATRATLQHLRLFNTFAVIDEALGYWVKPRSTTWFSRFLLHEYDDGRWIQMFRMTKRSIFNLVHLLAPTVKKKDTKYRLAFPVTVRIACTLFKLSHGASLLICNELFAVGRSTVSVMLREVVHAINDVLQTEISWPNGAAVASKATNFQALCGLPAIVGAIDGTHIAIAKPRFGAADYYYFKTGGYSINCQAVVDSSKRFLDLFVGMPGSTNDSRMLHRSSLYRRGQQRTLWDPEISFNGYSPYLLGDAGYPLLPWLMVPHRQQTQMAIADDIFNHKLSRGCGVVENAFGLLKLSFRELHLKCDLNIAFVPDVVTCCAILHNVLLQQSHEDVEHLLHVLHNKEQERQVANLPHRLEDVFDAAGTEAEVEEARQKRSDLGVFLSLLRASPL